MEESEVEVLMVERSLGVRMWWWVGRGGLGGAPGWEERGVGGSLCHMEE